MEVHSGSCLCKKIKYEIIGSFESFFLCHCKYCQKDTGSAHAANLFSQSATLTWIMGKQHLTTFTLPQTKHTKTFCNICGSALPSLQENGNLVVTPAGSLDSKINLRPDAHLFSSSRGSWDTKLELIEVFEKLPTNE